jgi:hypothetical protein
MIGGETLMARLGLDTSGFKAGLKDAHSSFSQLAGSMAKVAGISFGVSGLEEGVRKAVEYGAQISDLSTRFGVSAESLQKLGNAAELHGSSLEGVAKAFNKLEIAQSRALAGSTGQIEAFAHLGVSVDDLRKLSPEEIMVKLGKSSMDAADMVSILGRNALELIPTLQGLADGTIKYGKAISDLNIQKLKEADDAWKRLGQDLEIGGGHAVGAIFNLFGELKNHGTAAFDDLKTSGVSLWSAIKEAAHGNLSAAMKDVNVFANGMQQAWQSMDMTGWNDKKADGKKTTKAAPLTPPQRMAAEKAWEASQASFKELTDEGPHYGGPGKFNGGTAEKMYAAQQARMVQQLEAQSKQVRLTGISPTGESAMQLQGRADAIRQTLPIKETEKASADIANGVKTGMADGFELLKSINDRLG